jgi:hypothetical protein
MLREAAWIEVEKKIQIASPESRKSAGWSTGIAFQSSEKTSR